MRRRAGPVKDMVTSQRASNLGRILAGSGVAYVALLKYAEHIEFLLREMTPGKYRRL